MNRELIYDLPSSDNADRYHLTGLRGRWSDRYHSPSNRDKHSARQNSGASTEAIAYWDREARSDQAPDSCSCQRDAEPESSDI